MIKKLLLILSISFFISNETYSQGIAATLDYCNFKANDSLGLFEYYLSFPANTLAHRKSSAGKLVSEVKVIAGMVKQNDTVYIDSYRLTNSPNSEKSLKTEEYLTQHRIILPVGEYSFFLYASDLASDEPSNLSVNFPVKIGFDNALLQMSDIQNLKSYKSSKKQAPNVKNGVEMISRNSNFFAKADDRYIFYLEVYNSDQVIGKDATYLLEARITNARTGEKIDKTGIFKKLKADGVNPVLAEIDLSPVPSGDYNLVLEIKDRTNKSLYSKEKYFQRFHPDLIVEKEDEKAIELDSNKYDPCQIAESINMKNLDFLLDALMPMAKQNERAFAEAVVNSGDEKQKINFLCYFFQKRETKDKDARILFLEYKDRVEIVERKYKTQTMPGYQTDRGRVYIQYGKPNRIDDEFSDMSRSAINNAVIPYEKWIYYSVTEPQPQSNVQFVFAQTNRANFNYEIVHSTAIGEISNPNWKQEISSKMMFSEDPSQDYR
ncbi:MAG: GWxTD domain-containing protein [Cytophagales bacterium]